jgi:DNA-binding beta-propeller fold protein YncE
MFDFDFTVTDAVLSTDGQNLYLSSAPDKKLYIVNLSDGSTESISFDYTPESLALTPQGNYLYVALLTKPHSRYWFNPQEGYIAEISTDNNSLVRQFWINEDPFDIIVTSDNFLYVMPGSGQWDSFKSYDLTTTNQVEVAE